MPEMKYNGEVHITVHDIENFKQADKTIPEIAKFIHSTGVF